MSKWELAGPYGLLMMETRDVRWYWSLGWMHVTGIARGKQTPVDSRTLKPSENNYGGALHVILTLERSRGL
jgi:hypothetical protein